MRSHDRPTPEADPVLVQALEDEAEQFVAAREEEARQETPIPLNCKFQVLISVF